MITENLEVMYTKNTIQLKMGFQLLTKLMEESKKEILMKQILRIFIEETIKKQTIEII